MNCQLVAKACVSRSVRVDIVRMLMKFKMTDGFDSGGKYEQMIGVKRWIKAKKGG